MLQCGGPQAAVDAARPLLEAMGKRIIYCERALHSPAVVAIKCRAGPGCACLAWAARRQALALRGVEQRLVLAWTAGA